MHNTTLEIQDAVITKKFDAARIDLYRTMSIDNLQLPGIYAFVTENNDKYRNVVIDIRENKTNSSTLVKTCQKFYDIRNMRWSWHITSNPKDNDLTQHGLGLLKEYQSMYFDLITQPIHIQNNSLIIKEATEPSHLNDWIQPLNESFSVDDKNHKLMVRLMKDGCETLRHFVGYDNGNVACSGTLFISPESAMLNSLATRPAYKRRGFGTRLMLHIMQQAKEIGIEHIFLDSSEDALGMYKKIGFKVYSTATDYSFFGSS